MRKKEMIKRYVLCVVSLFILAFGVAFTKVGDLGVSPISSVANVLSIGIPQLSIGNWLIITNCIMILAQALMLRRNFKLYQLLQIPVSLLFGYFTDFHFCKPRQTLDVFGNRLAIKRFFYFSNRYYRNFLHIITP